MQLVGVDEGGAAGPDLTGLAGNCHHQSALHDHEEFFVLVAVRWVWLRSGSERRLVHLKVIAGMREPVENRPPRRRRRRRRRPGERGPRPEPSSEEPMTELEAEDEFPSEQPLGLSSTDDDADEEEAVDAEGDLEGEEDEAPRVYRNVPTWEEAISYLLHRRPNESRPNEGESSGSREPRRDGGRRPNRGDRSRD